jgi:hypothetical protein
VEWDIVYVEKDYLFAVKNAEREENLPVKVSIIKYDTINVQIFYENHEKKYYVINATKGEHSYQFKTDMLILSFKLKINASQEFFRS